MKKTNIWLALPAILGVIALSQPASAAVVSYTYSGSVDFGADDFGLFGEAGASLNGAGFTAVFSRDDALALPEDIVLGRDNSYVAGSGMNQPVTAVLTINGVAFEIGGVAGKQSQYDDGEYEAFSHFASGPGSSLTLGGGTLGTFAPMPGNVLASADYHTLASLPPGGFPAFALSGTFEFIHPDSNGSQRTFANFTPTGFLVGPNPDGGAGAVPEPATWAMMLAGFGGVGWTLRRRRAMAAFA